MKGFVLGNAIPILDDDHYYFGDGDDDDVDDDYVDDDYGDNDDDDDDDDYDDDDVDDNDGGDTLLVLADFHLFFQLNCLQASRPFSIRALPLW